MDFSLFLNDSFILCLIYFMKSSTHFIYLSAYFCGNIKSFYLCVFAICFNICRNFIIKFIIDFIMIYHYHHYFYHYYLCLLYFFFLIFYLLFIFGCVGSSFLCEGFLQLWRAGATLHHGARASHCRGLSRCRAQAPDAQVQQLWLTGPVAPRHVGSSQTRARTCVPCIGRQILNRCTTREALHIFIYEV